MNDQLATPSCPGTPADSALIDEAVARAEAYLEALELPDTQCRSLLERLRSRLAAYPHADRAALSGAMFEELQSLLSASFDELESQQLSGDRPRQPDLASVPARIQARFGRMPYYFWHGWPRLPSMPSIRRGHMCPPRLDRRFSNRVMQALRALPRWLEELAGGALQSPRLATRLRQLILFVLVAVPGFAATAYLATVLPHKGSTWLEVAILAAGFTLFTWIQVGFWTAVVGFFVRFFGDRYALDTTDTPESPIARDARTAIVMPICEEDVPRAFAGLQAVYESLRTAGQLEHFDFFVLSDTRDPDRSVAEEVAWADLCRRLDAHGRLYYRRRRTHLKRKNGNIADFCRRWGDLYRYMVVLDADSLMSAECLVRLVRTMERCPRAGLIQTQPMAVNRQTAIARIQQFALRAYGPLFAAGLHFWHIDNAHYWGHNAIIRLQPFMAHCALPRLPGEGALAGDILSHDFVEAALMRRAGWGVYLAFDLGGSYEEMPPTLLDELKRDRRWCKGNFQHLRLLFSDRLDPAHRALFANGVMAYASAFFWLIFLALSSIEAAWEALRQPEYFPVAGSLFPKWPVWQPIWALSLFSATLVVLFLPKVLGLVGIVIRREVRTFGGPYRLLASALLEIGFTTLIAPIRMLSHARFVFITLLGRSVRWDSQQRGDVGVPWVRALRYHGPGMLLAAVWGTGLYTLNPGFTWWLSPILLPLLLAPVITVYSSRPDLGRRIRRLGLFLIPEESCPPAILRRLERALAQTGEQPQAGFVAAAADPGVNALHCTLVRRAAALSPAVRRQRDALQARVLAAGPGALTSGDKAELLADGRAMEHLHAMLWSAPEWPWLGKNRSPS